MRIPFLTRLLEIKEEQLQIENIKLGKLEYIIQRLGEIDRTLQKRKV